MVTKGGGGYVDRRWLRGQAVVTHLDVLSTRRLPPLRVSMVDRVDAAAARHVQPRPREEEGGALGVQREAVDA